MGEYIEINARFSLSREQAGRLDCITDLCNRHAQDGRHLSRDEVFEGMFVLGSAHLIDERMEQFEQLLSRTPMREG